MNFTFVAALGQGGTAIVYRDGQYLEISFAEIAAYALYYGGVKGAWSARWIAVAYPWLVKKGGQALTVMSAGLGAPIGVAIERIGEAGLRDAAQAGIPEAQGLLDTPESGGQLGVLVKAGVKRTKMDQFATDLGRDYRRRYLAAESAVPEDSAYRAAVVGSQAENDLLTKDLPKRLQQYGIRPEDVELRPMTGVTGVEGGQTRYDLGIRGRGQNMFELQGSDYGGERKSTQLQGQQIGIAERTATYGSEGTLYTIVAKPGTVTKFTGADLSESVRTGNAPRSTIWRFLRGFRGR
jgi:hypothetical protein